MLTLWIFVFVASLILLVKGADWLLGSAEKIGVVIGLSPFIIGVLIVGLGTSFPELIAAMVAIIEGVPQIVVANAVGSNIANILLIVGVSAIVGKRLVVTKSLIDLDLPLLAVATFLFVGTAYDGLVTTAESVILLCAYTVYLLYNILYEEKDEVRTDLFKLLPTRATRRHEEQRGIALELGESERIRWQDIFFLILGIGALAIGAKYLIDSVVAVAAITGVGAGPITLAAVALGTSIPELLVSAKAAWNNKSSVALGNIFGSNVFNILVVVGLPGLFQPLPLDYMTLAWGLPVLVASTLLFIFSGISKRIHFWEGILYVLAYVFFIGKLFGLF